MSLGVAIKGPEGVVLAADSRVTLGAQRVGDAAPIVVSFDNATKLLSFDKPNTAVGAVTYGDAIIAGRTPHSFIPEFDVHLKKKGFTERLQVEAFAKELSSFYSDLWQGAMPSDYDGPGMTFIVGGYDDADAPYGRVFLFSVPNRPEPEEKNPGPSNFGMTWGGQLEIASRIVHGFDPGVPAILQNELKLDDGQVNHLHKVFKQRLQFQFPYNVLPLQDCVDLATFLVRTTITAQSLAVGIRGVGGRIEVAVITRIKGLEFVQRKKIHGEEFWE